MRISVIVATFNRAALLDECLEHLGRQRFGDGDEVIVVDNGSTDGTAEVVARHARLFPVPLRRLEERRPGKSIAVARGLSEARGDVFAFTDDDVNVDGQWLDALRAALSAPDVALVGGRVRPRWERRPPRWLAGGEAEGRLAAPLALADYGADALELGPRTAMGGNMAIRREVVERLGGFAAHLGSVRGTLLTGEDQELSRRVQAAGFRAMYTPSAVVYHWVPASRTRVGYMLRWFYWSGIANAAQDGAPSAGVLGVPGYLIKRLLVGMMAAPVLAACGRTKGAIQRAADAAFTLGYAAERWGMVGATRRRPPSATGQPA